MGAGQAQLQQSYSQLSYDQKQLYHAMEQIFPMFMGIKAAREKKLENVTCHNCLGRGHYQMDCKGSAASDADRAAYFRSLATGTKGRGFQAVPTSGTGKQ